MINCPVNIVSGPCWYCGTKVRSREGRTSSVSPNVVFHDRCIGTDNRRGNKFYLDSKRWLVAPEFNSICGEFPERKTMNRNPKRELHETGGEQCFIIWNPGAVPAPEQTYDTRKEAWEAADRMAAKYEGRHFLIMKSVGVSVTQKPVIRRAITGASFDD